MAASTPEDLLELVRDQGTFLAFAEALRRDREVGVRAEAAPPSNPYGPAAMGWQNGTIEDFLEAAIAWASDSSFGRSTGLNTSNVWRLCAQFLIAGKSYE